MVNPWYLTPTPSLPSLLSKVNHYKIRMEILFTAAFVTIELGICQTNKVSKYLHFKHQLPKLTVLGIYGPYDLHF